jgi:hypothetical protein
VLVKNGDMFEMAKDLKADAIVIPTNGCLKRNGSLVMGAGVAGYANNRYGGLAGAAGKVVAFHGNHVNIIALPNQRFEKRRTMRYIICFPVKKKEVKVLRRSKNLRPQYRKKFRSGQIAPGWMANASPRLIERSARELVELVSWYGFEKVIMPKPGCGNGGLEWSKVRSIIKPILSGKTFIVVNQV